MYRRLRSTVCCLTFKFLITHGKAFCISLLLSVLAYIVFSLFDFISGRSTSAILRNPTSYNISDDSNGVDGKGDRSNISSTCCGIFDSLGDADKLATILPASFNILSSLRRSGLLLGFIGSLSAMLQICPVVNLISIGNNRSPLLHYIWSYTCCISSFDTSSSSFSVSPISFSDSILMRLLLIFSFNSISRSRT